MAASASARLTSGAMSNSRGAPDPQRLQGLAEARAASAQALEADHEVFLAAHAGVSAGGGSAWAEDASAFQAAHRQAQERGRQGERVVPFVTENATGGLGARNGGRGFGGELASRPGSSAPRRRPRGESRGKRDRNERCRTWRGHRC
jgi:hypothetical protein